MEQNFQDRLKNYQLTPPEGVWSKIDDVLEGQSEKGFANKLFQFEIMPPQYIWQKLSFKIGNASNSPVRKRPIKRYLVYASIAASIILSIVTVNLLTGNKTTGSEESLVTTPKIGKPSNDLPSPDQNGIKITDSVNRIREVIDSSNHLIAASLTPSNKIVSAHKFSLKNIEERLIASASTLQKFIPESATRNHEISYDDGMDRYMIYASEDGNAVRLPKKMFDNIACPLNDASCKERIKQLQQKIALGSFASDFTGIIDLLSNMDDRK